MRQRLPFVWALRGARLRLAFLPAALTRPSFYNIGGDGASSYAIARRAGSAP